MPDALDSVKALGADYARWATTSDTSGEHVKADRQRRMSDNILAVTKELETARLRLRPIPKEFGDLSDLPEEVMAQLSLAKVDELEQQLRDIVASGDGAEVGLDAIIIELYRRHKHVFERRFIMNKLYRMGQKGIIESVEGKKGFYFVPRPWGSGTSSGKGAFDSDLDDDVPF